MNPIPYSLDVPDSSVQRPEVPSSVAIQGKTRIRRIVQIYLSESFRFLPVLEFKKHFMATNYLMKQHIFCLLKNLLNSTIMKKNIEVFTVCF